MAPVWYLDLFKKVSLICRGEAQVYITEQQGATSPKKVFEKTAAVEESGYVILCNVID